jgi:hypothetical protein
MGAKRQTDVAVVLHDLAAGGHRAKRDCGFLKFRNGLLLSG